MLSEEYGKFLNNLQIKKVKDHKDNCIFTSDVSMEGNFFFPIS